ncbi:TRAP transporter substrate-binding protein [bacterium]|nr:TRAP transporter substrate-binding protein [bacterium]
MSKKWIFCIITIFAIFSIAAAANAKSAKSIELRFAHHDPPMGPGGRSTAMWAKKVEEVTGGRVKITMYPASALAKANATYDAVKSKVAHIGWSTQALSPGRFPLTDLLSLPYIGVGSALEGSLALWNNYHKFPEVQAEYSDVKLLVLSTHQGAPIGTRKKAVKRLEDLKGLKIRATAGGSFQWLKAAGASPLTMPPFDIYMNVEKGVIDGWTIDLIGAEGFKIYEVTDYYTSPYYYVNCFWVAMNKDTWKSLPPDVQQAIEKVSGEWAIRNIFAANWDAGDKASIKRMGIRADQMLMLPDEDIAKSKEIAKKVWAEVIGKLEANGKPAQKIFDETLRFLQAYK